MKYAVLVAGGTGGHINAALAIGEALKDQGFETSPKIRMSLTWPEITGGQ